MHQSKRASDTVPKTLTYTIRFKTGDVPDTREDISQPWVPNPAKDSKTLSSGQAFLMETLENAFVRLHMKANNLDVSYIGSYVKDFPYPCYIYDRFLDYLKYLLPFLMVLSWVATVAIATKTIVYEKESRLKETMKIMGLKNVTHWFSYFISIFVILFVTLILLSIIVKFGKILTFTDLSLLLFLYLAYAISTVIFCFFMSVLFGKANLSAAVSSIVFFITWLPFSVYQAYEYEVPMGAIMVIALFPNSAFSIAIAMMVDFERQGKFTPVIKTLGLSHYNPPSLVVI